MCLVYRAESAGFGMVPNSAMMYLMACCTGVRQRTKGDAVRIISLEPNHRYVSLFVVIVVTGCSDAQPSTEVLKGAISQNVSGMTIENIECQSFADKSQEAAGRSSCKGTMSLNQDQHVLLYRNDAERLLISAGIPKTGAGYFLSRHPAQVYTLAASKGSVAEFSSECGYHRAVDAWNIGCSSNLPTFQGRPAYDIRPNDVVEGTPSYDVWIEQIKSDFKRLDQDYQTLETQVRTFFAPGKTISLRLREAGQILYQAQISKGISWEGEPGVLGHQGDFSTIVKYRDLRERRV